jgi:hypothetical protein
MRHMDDPAASIAGVRKGLLPGSWIVPGKKVDELMALRFQLVSPEPVDENGVACMPEPAPEKSASSQLLASLDRRRG